MMLSSSQQTLIHAYWLIILLFSFQGD